MLIFARTWAENPGKPRNRRSRTRTARQPDAPRFGAQQRKIMSNLGVSPRSTRGRSDPHARLARVPLAPEAQPVERPLRDQRLGCRAPKGQSTRTLSARSRQSPRPRGLAKSGSDTERFLLTVTCRSVTSIGLATRSRQRTQLSSGARSCRPLCTHGWVWRSHPIGAMGRVLV